MTRNKQQQYNPRGEELAKAFAQKVIKSQSWLAARLNKWFNHFSKLQQQWLLTGFCILTGSGLILCLIVPYGKMAINNPHDNYQASHIGLPSNRPEQMPIKRTDSLTIKK